MQLLALMCVPLLTVASLPLLARLENGLEPAELADAVEVVPPSGR
ncbi:MAG TPA: hypothetical protein VGD11_11915 [Mycobacteriales bacterium]|jgi:hypothetical protein